MNERVFVVATVFLLAWGALAFGANYPWAYWPLMLGAACTGLAGLLTSPRSAAFSRPLVWALVFLSAAVLVQLLPLPAALLARISPATHDLLQRQNLQYAVAAGDAVHPISIRPASTWLALGFLFSYSLLMLGTGRFLTRATLRRLAGGIIALGACIALIGIVQMPFFDGKIYGFWEPMTRNNSFGPFVNHNHFAGWMLLALPLAVTFSVARVTRGMNAAGATRRDRLLWWSTPEASGALLSAFAAILMAASLLLTMSRSGIVAAVAAMALVAGTLLRQPSSRRSHGAIALAIVAVGMLLAYWVGFADLAERFSTGRASTLSGRLPIWRDTLSIVRDFLLTGTGLNTYGYATVFYQTVAGEGHLREAHSDYLQLAAEGGLLLGVPIVVATMCFVREIRRRFEAEQSGTAYWLRLGACCGLTAIAIQSIAEFSLQMPGNAALFAVLAGIALHGPAARNLDILPTHAAPRG